jgi:hypothetical protein
MVQRMRVQPARLLQQALQDVQHLHLPAGHAGTAALGLDHPGVGRLHHDDVPARGLADLLELGGAIDAELRGSSSSVAPPPTRRPSLHWPGVGLVRSSAISD